MSNAMFDLDAPVADLDAPSSDPVFIAEAGGVILTVIRVFHDMRVGDQVYAIAEGSWELVGIYGLYVDALSSVQAWKTYLADGATVADWRNAHPDGVAPMHAS